MSYRVFFLLLTLLFVGCARPQTAEPTRVEPAKTIFDEIYRPSENLLPKRIVGIKHDTVRCPRYIKVWVGSYRDKAGNFVPGGWIWLKVGDCGPETNF